MEISSKVPTGFKNALIVDYLSARFTYFSAEKWAELVKNGRLSHNNQSCTLETRLRQGDTVTYNMPDPDPPEDLDVGIVYEDEWLLGVNKPPNFRVHSKGRFVTENLIYYLRYQHDPAFPEADLVNRLDANTSGVVVLARDKETLRQMSDYFRTGQVEKTYWAVVVGQPTPAKGVIELPLGKVPGSKTARQQVMDEGEGKTAVTHYQTIETLGADHALVQLQPKTGRTHQLRVHMAAIGHPLVGDALYQMDDAKFLHWVENGRSISQIPHLQRQALHSATTQFTHPVTGKTCIFSAPLPDDMVRLIEELKAR